MIYLKKGEWLGSRLLLLRIIIITYYWYYVEEVKVYYSTA